MSPFAMKRAVPATKPAQKAVCQCKHTFSEHAQLSENSPLKPLCLLCDCKCFVEAKKAVG